MKSLHSFNFVSLTPISPSSLSHFLVTTIPSSASKSLIFFQILHLSDTMQYFSLSVWLISLCIISSILIHTIIESKIDKNPSCNTVWKFLQKLKIELPYDSAIPLSVKKVILGFQRDIFTLMFIATLFTSQYMEITINLWVKKWRICYLNNCYTTQPWEPVYVFSH